MSNPNTPSMTPAVPPTDYRGSVADWVRGLQELGWSGNVWYGDFEITTEQWRDLLEKCEED